jgi:hypothetical protein
MAEARPQEGSMTNTTTTATSAAGNTAYRNGFCVDCHVEPYSPGRPRCDECHRIHVNVMAGYDQ